VAHYYLPVRGLFVEEKWVIGVVTFLPAVMARAQLSERIKPNVSSDWRDAADEAIARIGNDSVALTDAESYEEMLSVVEDAVAVLRVFQQYGTRWETTMFGLPSQVDSSATEFFTVDKDGRLTLRGKNTGHALGYTFSQSERDRWLESAGFIELADSVGRENPNEGQRRAIQAVRLLGHSILEKRPSLKVLHCLMAMEAMLLPDQMGSMTFMLARHHSYFSCRGPESRRCGESGDPCPCISLDPKDKSGLRNLKRLRDAAEVDPSYRCSVWLRSLHWYEERSRIAHGNAGNFDFRDARSIEFQVTHELFVPAVTWLLGHGENPIGDLLDHLSALPEMGQEMKGIMESLA
jgi:hypothetical protein